MDLSSEELLVQVATGDKRAFGELYDRLAARVMGICMQVLRNRAIAEEITQEVFVEIWRTAPMFSPERGNTQGWMRDSGFRSQNKRFVENRPVGWPESTSEACSRGVD